MKKLIKQGAKLAHVLIDMLAEEIAEKPLKEKKKKNGTNKENNSSRRSISDSTNQHIHEKEVEKYE